MVKITVGLSKKIGQPIYGSLGADVHIEFEFPPDANADAAANDLTLRDRARHFLDVCEEAVNAKLAESDARPKPVEQAPDIPAAPNVERENAVKFMEQKCAKGPAAADAAWKSLSNEVRNMLRVDPGCPYFRHLALKAPVDATS
jgi:hypothetical protein